MKQILCCIALVTVFSMWTVPVEGQRVSFSFQDGLGNKPELKKKMTTTISNLLSEIQSAYLANRQLELSRFGLSADARKSLNATWNNYGHFSIDFNEIITECLQSYTSYEVRQIYITFHRDGKEINRELTIGFTGDGTMTFVRPALENHSFGDIIYTNNEVADARERMEILNFVERFRNYYNEKDVDALDSIYSDDALIITAKVIMKRQTGDGMAKIRPDVIYDKKSKADYMKSLRKVFNDNDFLNVEFDSIVVLNHPSREHFYGVTLHQKWRSSKYKDEGYVFLLWQFPENSNDPNQHPIVHVRTWQPDEIVKQGIKKLDTNDFIIPAKTH